MIWESCFSESCPGHHSQLPQLLVSCHKLRGGSFTLLHRRLLRGLLLLLGGFGGGRGLKQLEDLLVLQTLLCLHQRLVKR